VKAFILRYVANPSNVSGVGVRTLAVADGPLVFVSAGGAGTRISYAEYSAHCSRSTWVNFTSVVAVGQTRE